MPPLHTLMFALILLLVGTTDGYAQMIQGVCFSGPPRAIGDSSMARVQAIGAEWIALMPYAYGPDADGRIIFLPEGGQWWGEGPDGIRSMVRMAKARGMKVMLKPHLWLGHGRFTGTYAPDSATGWKPFEESYARYVLHYALLARELDVDLFCIGTELERFVHERTGFWQILVDRVSDAYQGPLTYAANWDEVERFPLWKRMDHIGVDGYFPLCMAERPDMELLAASWRPHKAMLKDISTRMGRPVLFTEMGYCSSSSCAAEPWKEDRNATRDEGAQAMAYEAFFTAFRNEPYFSGCFVWKWFADHGIREERHGVGYSPQGKLAIEVLREAYQ